jgi:hypothetical protein
MSGRVAINAAANVVDGDVDGDCLGDLQRGIVLERDVAMKVDDLLDLRGPGTRAAG